MVDLILYRVTKKSMKKGDYYSNKIKIKDSVTGKNFYL